MDNNDKKNDFLFKSIIIGFVAFALAWVFFCVKGFAYDLSLSDYDFNGFDSNADSIFIDFISNDLDLYNHTEKENLQMLIKKLKNSGYTDDYINQFKIKPSPSPTPYQESEEVKRENLKNEILNEINTKNEIKNEVLKELNDDSGKSLGTDNGATDCIVSDENMNVRSLENTSGHNLDDIYDLLSDIYNSQYSMSDSISDMNTSIEHLSENYTEIEYTSALEKPIESYSVKETILLIIALLLVFGGIGFMIFKFVPTFHR